MKHSRNRNSRFQDVVSRNKKRSLWIVGRRECIRQRNSVAHAFGLSRKVDTIAKHDGADCLGKPKRRFR